MMLVRCIGENLHLPLPFVPDSDPTWVELSPGAQEHKGTGFWYIDSREIGERAYKFLEGVLRIKGIEISSNLGFRPSFLTYAVYFYPRWWKASLALHQTQTPFCLHFH